MTNHEYIEAPDLGRSHLLGGGLEIRLEPHIVIAHHEIVRLHGMMTALIGSMQRTKHPKFALVKWQAWCGWGIYTPDDDVARGLSGWRSNAVLGGADVAVSFGLLQRLRVPERPQPGMMRIRIEAITPVCIRSLTAKGTAGRTAPSSSSILSTLTQGLPPRLGLRGFDPSSAVLELVSADFDVSGVNLGRKYSGSSGWTGSCVVEANAVARWLLACAALIGLGGRTAFGFGRIKISEET